MTAALRSLKEAPPEAVDRMLIGLCAVIWLAFVGMLVGVIVVLAQMGQRAGPEESAGSSGSSLGIYIVIGVCLAVIIGAVPLLLRARKLPARHPVRRPPADDPTRTQKLNSLEAHAAPGSPAHRTGTAPHAAVVERLWLRATVGIAGAIGLALLGVVTGTYLMVIGSGAASISAFVFAGLVTAAMGVIPWQTVKRLRELG